MTHRPAPTFARSIRRAATAAAVATVLVSGPAIAGVPDDAVSIPPSAIAAGTTAEPATSALDDAAAIRDCIGILLGMQESLSGEDGPAAEWPYEGVYRVRAGRERRIPIGYRVGGTSICGTALLEAPGLDDDDGRRDAIRRGIEFVIAATDEPLMKFPFAPTYDVRGWGYAYGLDFLLRAEAAKIVPQDRRPAVTAAIRFFIDGIAATELSEGGWNYAMRRGRSDASPFMTAPTLTALLRAVDAGHTVERAMIDRALDTLDAARSDDGSVVYAGRAGNRRDGLPGATGRMLSSEVALTLAGRGDAERLGLAVDAFFEHWNELEKRRRKNGTHEPPYGVAPYYFFYAHHAAAAAIELLPAERRVHERERLRERFAEVREPDGSWNDRVFPRSANYGTAMTMLALMMPETGAGVAMKIETPAEKQAEDTK